MDSPTPLLAAKTTVPHHSSNRASPGLQMEIPMTEPQQDLSESQVFPEIDTVTVMVSTGSNLSLFTVNLESKTFQSKI